jgi:hypothetical protein
MTIEATERSDEQRDLYWMRIAQYQPHQLVFADESAYNRLTSRRQYGWSFEGLRACHRNFFVRGEK